MGCLLGRENFLPSARFIPLVRRYSCWNLAKSIVCPSLVVKCFIAAMCSLTLLCELYEDRCVAYRMSVFSDGGTARRL